MLPTHSPHSQQNNKESNTFESTLTRGYDIEFLNYFVLEKYCKLPNLYISIKQPSLVESSNFAQTREITLLRINMSIPVNK